MQSGSKWESLPTVQRTGRLFVQIDRKDEITSRGGCFFWIFRWTPMGKSRLAPQKVPSWQRASGISSSHCCFESLQDCRKGILLISSRCSNYFPNDGIPLFSFAVILHHFRPKNLCNRYSSSIFPTLIVARFFLPMILNTPRILVRAKAYLAKRALQLCVERKEKHNASVDMGVFCQRAIV